MKSSTALLSGILSLALFAGSTLEAQNLPKTPPTLKLNDPLPGNLFVELGRVINPAVVNISTSVIPRGRMMRRDPLMDLFQEFYGIQPPPQQMAPGKPQRLGLGTGFIIREDGLIVTNNHVIKEADIVQVQLTENTEELYEAKVIGSDERSDIALIKIDVKKKLPVAVLGNSKDLQVGEWVAAFGNPYGHGHSMTKGIVSSIGRQIGEINRFPLIQTDASINPGNSGGPLVNSKGLVIGVNSAIDARAQGIGFAIPIDEVKLIIPQLETRGSVRKGYLGAGLGDVDPASAEQLGLGESPGAVIVTMEKGGPAAKAGVKAFDIVTEFGDKKIRTSVDLIDAVAGSEPGKSYKMKVVRNRKPITLDVVLAERKDKNTFKPAIEPKKSNAHKAPFDLGFQVADMNDDLRAQWEIPEEVSNPVIVEMDRNAMALKLGLRVGDIILEVNQTATKTAKEVLKALKKGKENTMQIARGNRILVLTFDIK